MVENEKILVEIYENFFIILIPAISSIITLFIVFCKDIEEGLKSLGISGVIITMLLVIILAFIIAECLTRENNKDDHLYKDKADIINRIFKMSYVALKYPNDNPKINIHYYLYEKNEEGEFLIKQREFGFESELLSVDYFLEKCRIDSRNIVMCEAFKKNCVIFKNLPSNHKELYDSDVKKYIDKDIKWVLAGPVWKHNETSIPSGVIVIFSLEPITFNDQIMNEKLLKNFCVELSKSISDLITEN